MGEKEERKRVCHPLEFELLLQLMLLVQPLGLHEGLPLVCHLLPLLLLVHPHIAAAPAAAALERRLLHLRTQLLERHTHINQHLH